MANSKVEGGDLFAASDETLPAKRTTGAPKHHHHANINNNAQNSAAHSTKQRKASNQNDFPDFSKLKTLLLFIGYPRSGSTLFGSLLDAHPHIVIANEYNLVGQWKNFTKAKKTKEYIFNELWKNSVAEALSKQRAKEKLFYFSYFVPGLWQGKYRNYISIIGDKRCVSTTRGLSVNTTRFTDLSTKLKVPIKFIHIIRNPFDTIATMTMRSSARRLRMKAGENSSLKVNVPHLLRTRTELYFQLVDMNVQHRKRFGSQVLDVDYTAFIKQPKKIWRSICDFLEIHCNGHYVNSIASVVFKKETYTRRHIVWTDSVKQSILNKIKSVSFLKGMTFEIPQGAV